METQERPGEVTSRSQLRGLADAATEVIDYLIERFDGDNYSLLKTRPDIWPPIDTAKSEALTRLVAAFELEHAAHAAQRSFIRQARETAHSWHEIGQALDLLWQAVCQQGISPTKPTTTPSATSGSRPPTARAGITGLKYGVATIVMTPERVPGCCPGREKRLLPLLIHGTGL